MDLDPDGVSTVTVAAVMVAGKVEPEAGFAAQSQYGSLRLLAAVVYVVFFVPVKVAATDFAAATSSCSKRAR
jgi:hypothetical protein